MGGLYRGCGAFVSHEVVACDMGLFVVDVVETEHAPSVQRVWCVC